MIENGAVIQVQKLTELREYIPLSLTVCLKNSKEQNFVFWRILINLPTQNYFILDVIAAQ